MSDWHTAPGIDAMLEGAEEERKVYIDKLPYVSVSPKPRTFADGAKKICDDIYEMLIAKNQSYGNSALNPVRIFSRADKDEQLRVRIDDKLSRLARGEGQETEEVLDDLIGYFIILKMHLQYKM